MNLCLYSSNTGSNCDHYVNIVTPLKIYLQHYVYVTYLGQPIRLKPLCLLLRFRGVRIDWKLKDNFPDALAVFYKITSLPDLRSSENSEPRLENGGDITAAEVKKFYQAVCSFYTHATDYALKNLPLKDDILKNAKFANLTGKFYAGGVFCSKISKLITFNIK